MRTVEVDEIPHYDLVSKLLLELVPVLVVTWESVKQVPSVSSFLDGISEQPNNEIGGEEFPFLDEAIDGLCQFSTFLRLFSEEVAGGEVFEAVVSDEVVSLGAFAAARPP